MQTGAGRLCSFHIKSPYMLSNVLTNVSVPQNYMSHGIHASKMSYYKFPKDDCEACGTHQQSLLGS